MIWAVETNGSAGLQRFTYRHKQLEHRSMDLSGNAADPRTGGGGREEVDGLAGHLDVVRAGVGQPDLESDLGPHQHAHGRRSLGPAALVAAGVTNQETQVEEGRRAEAARARRRQDRGVSARAPPSWVLLGFHDMLP